MKNYARQRSQKIDGSAIRISRDAIVYRISTAAAGRCSFDCADSFRLRRSRGSFD
jgi:hypothetical protein